MKAKKAKKGATYPYFEKGNKPLPAGLGPLEVVAVLASDKGRYTKVLGHIQRQDATNGAGRLTFAAEVVGVTSNENKRFGGRHLSASVDVLAPVEGDMRAGSREVISGPQIAGIRYNLSAHEAAVLGDNYDVSFHLAYGGIQLPISEVGKAGTINTAALEGEFERFSGLASIAGLDLSAKAGFSDRLYAAVGLESTATSAAAVRRHSFGVSTDDVRVEETQQDAPTPANVETINA